MSDVGAKVKTSAVFRGPERAKAGTCLAALAMTRTEEASHGRSELFTKGLETRRQVLGAKYVDANLAGSDDFMMTFHTRRHGIGLGLCVESPRA